jgi:hypothetical protein
MAIKLLKWGAPSPPPDAEPVVAELRQFRALTSTSWPSYKITCNLPPLWSVWLLVTPRRCLILADFGHFMAQEITAWYPGQNPPGDLETLVSVACCHGLFGRCLELRTHNPGRRARWLWSPALTLRFFIADPESLCATITAQMAAAEKNTGL